MPHSATAKPQVGLVLTAVFVTYLAQMSLNPVIAPLSRELGLTAWQLGLIISVAAMALVVLSGFWGRRSMSWGRKPVLVTAMIVGAVAMTAFAVLSVLGSRGSVAPSVLFWLMILTRGVLFGGAIAAMIPTAQAYVANVTETQAARVRGMAGVGAVQGIAMIFGATLGGLLSAFGVLTPVIAVPIILTVGAVVVAVGLRPEPASALIAHPKRVHPLDPRVWPFLAAGFGLLSALGFIQVVSGFLMQDRLGLTSSETGLMNGGALLLAGAGLAFAQAVVVPRLGRSPGWLLRFGAAIACVGFLVLLIDAGPAPLLIGMLISGFGIGSALPGFSAGPSLLLAPDEQGGIAGLIGATSGLTFVVAPTLSTALYGVWGPLPVLIGAALLAVVVAFTGAHPAFRAQAVAGSGGGEGGGGGVGGGGGGGGEPA